MSSHDRMSPDENGARRVDSRYEPPRVEKVLSQGELEQEILYAGFDPLTDDTDGTPM